MIKTYLQTKNLLESEPKLTDYLDSDFGDYETYIDNAYRELNKDIRNKGLDMRYVCVPLTVTDDDEPSAEDTINRSLLNLNITAITGSASIQLTGCNTSDGTFIDIDTINLLETGIAHLEFFDFYTYYKIVSTGTITFTATLTESIYFHLHLYKTLAIIYLSMERVSGDKWFEKRLDYEDKYMQALDKAKLYIDLDGDGEVDEDEATLNLRSYRITL